MNYYYSYQWKSIPIAIAVYMQHGPDLFVNDCEKMDLFIIKIFYFYPTLVFYIPCGVAISCTASAAIKNIVICCMWQVPRDVVYLTLSRSLAHGTAMFDPGIKLRIRTKIEL